MKELYVMCGISGSGKSTFAKRYFSDDKDTIIISRDEIRFSKLQPGEDYFAHEKEVLRDLWAAANAAIKEGKNVVIDQTSLTPKTRKQVLRNVTGYKRATTIYIDTSIETALEQNSQRKGRALVPAPVIKSMQENIIFPSNTEGFNEVWIIKDGRIWGINF